MTEVTRLTRGNLRHIEDLIDRVERDDITILALRAGEMDLATHPVTRSHEDATSHHDDLTSGPDDVRHDEQAG